MNTGLLRYAVGTVLTVYGIETSKIVKIPFPYDNFVGTVLTVYGIETAFSLRISSNSALVGTVLTVYGIETLCGCRCIHG